MKSPRDHARLLPLCIAGIAVIGVGLTAGISQAAGNGRHGSASPQKQPHDSAVGTMPVPAGFPNASTTGPLAGLPLTPYTGSTTITTPHTTIVGALINGCVLVRAVDVHIIDSKIACTQNLPVLAVHQTSLASVFISDELDGTGVAPVGLDAQDVIAENLNIHDTADGAHLGHEVTLLNSYIHDLASQPGLHHDCLQTSRAGAATNLKIVHNTLQDFTATSNGNSVYHGGSASISNELFVGNYMDGGQYSVELTNGPNQHSVVFRGNEFGRDYHFNILHLQDAGRGVTFANNLWADTLQPATIATASRH